jgi:putative component of membrane protein insertase Oxa1/YidC/SpoIIIJ protein YidD
MNERIKELAGQALDESVSETWSSLDADQLKRYTDMLAKLIIQECMNVVGNKTCPNYAYKAIQKHFGVEYE